MVKTVFWVIVLAILSGLAWVRLAPSDPGVWHVDPQASADQDLAAGVRRRIPDGDATLARLDAIIRATPRTDLLAGGVEEGHVTYVTRSRWIGFPDYTTVQRGDGVIEIWGRARFGQSDLGVNRARVDGWLQTLGAEG